MTQTTNQTGKLIELFENQLKPHIRDYYKLQCANNTHGFTSVATMNSHITVIEQLIQNDDIDLTTQTIKKTCNHKRYKPTPPTVVKRLREVTIWMQTYRRDEYDQIFSQIQEIKMQLHQLQQDQHDSRVENRQLHQETRDATLLKLQQLEQQQQHQYAETKEFQSKVIHGMKTINNKISQIDNRLSEVEHELSVFKTSHISFHEIIQDDDIVGDDIVSDDIAGDSINHVSVDEIVADD